MKVGIGMHSLLVQLLSAADVSFLMLAASVLKKCDPVIVGIAGIGTVSRILLVQALQRHA